MGRVKDWLYYSGFNFGVLKPLTSCMSELLSFYPLQEICFFFFLKHNMFLAFPAAQCMKEDVEDTLANCIAVCCA